MYFFMISADTHPKKCVFIDPMTSRVDTELVVAACVRTECFERDTRVKVEGETWQQESVLNVDY